MEKERERERPSFQCPKFNVNIWNSVPSVLQRDWTRDDIFEWMNEWMDENGQWKYIHIQSYESRNVSMKKICSRANLQLNH